MRPKKFIETCKILFANRMSILVAGSPGIGKTQILKMIAKQLGMDVMFYHPQYADHGEVAGVTWVWVSPDGKEMKADRVPLANVEPIFTADKPTLVIIDDLGHAMQSIQNSFMQLVEERRIGIRPISKHIVFAASTNRKEDSAGAKTITSTMSNRFQTTVTLEPSVEDLIEYALSANWNDGMPAYLNFSHSKADPVFELPPKDGAPFCTPRSLDKLQAMESAFELEGLTLWREAPELVSGTIGIKQADRYVGFMKVRGEIEGLPQAVYKDPDTADVPQRPDVQYALVGAIAMRATGKNMGTMIKYLKRLPKEMEVVGVMDACRRDKNLKNCTAYNEWIVANQKWIINNNDDE